VTQLSFELPELDRRATQEAVEELFEKYRMIKTIDFEEREAVITAAYEQRESQRTNVTSDQTANIAIHNVDVPAARKKFCERVERAVSRLHPKERLLIESRYMQDYVFDYQVHNEIFKPRISKTTYDKIRWKAFYKLALILDLPIEKKE
jgi:ArpU family phage transcriptional regulator